MKIIRMGIEHSITSAKEYRYNWMYYQLSTIIKRCNSELDIKITAETAVMKGWIPIQLLPIIVYSYKLV